MNTRLVEGMDKFLAKYKDEDKKKAPKKLKESVEKEVLTKEDIDKFFTDYDRKIRRRIRYEIKHGDYGDYDMWDAIEDELYEANPKDFTPEIEKYFKKRIWQIIDEYEGTNYAEEELDEGYKKPLNEDSILDKINKYLDSIGEAPITESKEDNGIKVSGLDAYRVQRAVDDINYAFKMLGKFGIKHGEDVILTQDSSGKLSAHLRKGLDKNKTIERLFLQLENGCNFFNNLRLKKDKDYIFKKDNDGIYAIELKMQLNEDKNSPSIVDQINKYLKDQGDKPVDFNAEVKEAKFDFDKLDKYLKKTYGFGLEDVKKDMKKEEKKSIKISESLNRRSAHPGDLFESLNRGFEKLYGKVEDPVLENKYSSSNSKKKITEDLTDEDLTDEEKKDNETFIKLFRRLRSTQQVPLTKEMEDLLDKYGLEARYGYVGEIKMPDQVRDVNYMVSERDTIFSTGDVEEDKKINWVDKIKKMRERNPQHLYISGFNPLNNNFPQYYDDDRIFNSSDYVKSRNQAEIASNLRTKEGVDFLVQRKNKAIKEIKNPNSNWSKGQCIDFILAYNKAVDKGIIKYGKKVDISELLKD